MLHVHPCVESKNKSQKLKSSYLVRNYSIKKKRRKNTIMNAKTEKERTTWWFESMKAKGIKVFLYTGQKSWSPVKIKCFKQRKLMLLHVYRCNCWDELWRETEFSGGRWWYQKGHMMTHFRHAFGYRKWGRFSQCWGSKMFGRPNKVGRPAMLPIPKTSRGTTLHSPITSFFVFFSITLSPPLSWE